MEEGSLEDHLFEPHKGSQLSSTCKSVTVRFLDWPMRLKIALGTASGLAYLHDVSCILSMSSRVSTLPLLPVPPLLRALLRFSSTLISSCSVQLKHHRDKLSGASRFCFYNSEVTRPLVPSAELEL